MLEWLEDHQVIMWTLVGASVAVFVLSVLLMPVVVVRIPVDYFAHPTRPPSRWADARPVTRVLARIGKNVLGGTFILAGLAMLALPGQGLLTIFAGFLLVDVPGKYRFEKWLLRRRIVARPINWMRRRGGRPPLQVAGGAGNP